MSTRRSTADYFGILTVMAFVFFGHFQSQAQTPKYKVGDRVQVDIIEATNPANAKWKNGTIIAVDTGTAMAYTVEVDPLPGRLPGVMHVPIRPYAEGWLKPLAGGANGGGNPGNGGGSPKTQTDVLRVDDTDTVLADRDLLDCAHMKQPKARNGSPLPVELAQKLIRCLYEKPSEQGSDGATTMDIVEFKPTASRRWILKEDRGSAATADTIVYPIRVKWDQKTFYRSYNQTQTGNERIFTCFVDGDIWYCGSAQFIKDGEKQQIVVKKN